MKRTLKIYYTSDTHGHISPVDYLAGVPEARGILSLAVQMKKDENALVLDGEDTLQGTPFSQYYLEHPNKVPCHPMAAAFNAAGHDYITLGNHDFNFGCKALRDYLQALDAQCLCANMQNLRGELGVLSEVVHTLENGLKIGISGIVTDCVNVWEQPETLAGLRITDAFTAASHAYERLRPQCGICICIYHGGFERDLQDGRILFYTGENIGWKLCEELGYDLVLTGHRHATIGGTDMNKTYAVQCSGEAERYIFLEVEEEDKEVDIGSRILPVEEEHERELYDTLLPFECMVEQRLNQLVGWMANDILPEEKLKATLGSSRMAALFSQAQLAIAGVELSCTSLGNTPVGLYSPVTMKEIYRAYPFDNTLVVLEADETVLRASLERCTVYFTLKDGEPAISEVFLEPELGHFSYDFYAGISYVFDIGCPAGQRVTKLARTDDTPLGEGKLWLCTSNYRATGIGGYELLSCYPVLWRGTVQVPELIARYIRSNSPVKLPNRESCQVVWQPQTRYGLICRYSGI